MGLFSQLLYVTFYDYYRWWLVRVNRHGALLNPNVSISDVGCFERTVRNSFARLLRCLIWAIPQNGNLAKFWLSLYWKDIIRSELKVFPLKKIDLVNGDIENLQIASTSTSNVRYTRDYIQYSTCTKPKNGLYLTVSKSV